MSKTFPTALVILDGLGISCQKKYNAFYQAHTPHLDLWQSEKSYTQLQAAGRFVGLPDPYNGNSEVGHFALGAGRIIAQTSTILNHTMQYQTLHTTPTLTKELKNFNPKNKVHLLGLASDGNIHSNIDHAKSLISTLHHYNFSNILVHAFLDGRDTSPRSAIKYLDILQTLLDKYQCGKIATIHGRFYAMDRNKNLDRTQKSFDVLTHQQSRFTPYQECIQNNYAQNISDEFIEPTACIQDHTIEPGDGVIFFNFRPDRAIQLTKMLMSCDLGFFITPVIYHKDLPTTPIIQATQADHTLLETIFAHKKSMFTIAETEKYAHVTYFFNGHKDINFASEQRVLIPSLTHENLAEHPEMQAQQITTHVLNSLQADPCDFYLINYANADMIGHTGNLDATIKAIEFLDVQLAKLHHEIVIQQKGTMYITADHGNAEKMFDENCNQPCTSHTNNPVPFYMLSSTKKQDLDLQSLADVAPFILKNMNIAIPDVMQSCVDIKRDPYQNYPQYDQYL